MFIYFRDRETEHQRGRGTEPETESEASSRLWAVSTEPDAGLKLTDREIVTWAEVGHPTDWATRVPLCVSVYGHLIQYMLLICLHWTYGQ